MAGARHGGQAVTVTRREFVAGAIGAVPLIGGMPASARSAPAPIALRRGVNTWPWFSQTREYPPPRTDYGDPPFQVERPVPTGADLAAIRSAGFDFIRLPVDPGPLLAADASAREVLEAAVFGAIHAARTAGLAVVLNLHGNAATHHFTPTRMYGGTDAPLLSDYVDLVERLATRLGALDPAAVALEPVNEPPQACTGGDWQAVQMRILGAARAAAPALTLVATGPCGSMIEGLAALDPEPLADLAPLLFTVHFYEPYLFSHQGATWMTGEPFYRWLNGVPWPASAGSRKRTLAAVRARMAADLDGPADLKADALRQIEEVLRVYFDADPARWFVDKYLAQAAVWADRHRVPRERILLGEFGALRTDARYTAAAAPDRARYVRDVRRSAEQHGFAWAFWNLFDGMGLMDDETRTFDAEILKALGLGPA